MVKHSFHVQPSRYAGLIQGVFFVLIGSILYMQLIFSLWLVCMVMMLLSYGYFLAQQQQVSQLEYLADEDWSLYDVRHQQIQRVQIQKILDHHVYIVIFFQHKSSSLMIWQDQLSHLEWKKLKVLAKLY